MNKLNEEETKLKQKSCMEIGTWSNDMAKEALNQVERGPPREFTEGGGILHLFLADFKFTELHILVSFFFGKLGLGLQITIRSLVGLHRARK